MKRYIVLFLFCFIASSIVSADEASLDELSRRAERTTQLAAEFTQTKHLKILTKPIISQGRLFFEAPNSLRWEYTSPVKSLMLLNKGELTVYTFAQGAWLTDQGPAAEARQLVVGEITAWMRGRFDQGSGLTPSLVPGAVVLTPDESLRDFITEIKLVIDEPPNLIQKVLIFEGEGNLTEITFHNVRLNAGLPPHIFEAGR